MTSRREFMAAVAAASAAAALPAVGFAQSKGATPKDKKAAPKHRGVIDTHFHFWAPEYLKLTEDWGAAHHARPDPRIANWSPQVALDEMDSGGATPYIAGRMEAFFKDAKNLHDIAPNGVMAELQRLHYDTVNVTAAPSFAALTKLAPMTNITYGTDFPYFANDQLDTLDQRGLSAKDLAAIHSGNAKRLIPRLAKA
jgi:hypothetical protein